MKQIKQLLAILIGILLTFALAACTPTVNETGSQPETPLNREDEPTIVENGEKIDKELEIVESELTELIGTKWDLVAIGELDALGSGATLDFSEGQIGGSDGCNSYGGGYKIENGRFALDGDTMSTLMACLDGMEIPDRFWESLSDSGAIILSGDDLIIESSKGDLVFVAAVSADLENTKWGLSSLNSGDALVSMAIDQDIFLMIEGDAIGGNGGCNIFGGGVEIDENQVVFKEIFSTEMFCEGEGISEREREFLAALDQVTSFEILRQTLTMFDAGGNTVATFNVVDETAEEEMMEAKTIFVGAEQVDCVGVAPQKCLLIKEDPNADYTYFYDSIVGFEWEAGFEYELLVNITDVENPPADASSLRYELVEIVNKTPVDSAESMGPLEGMTWSLVHMIVGGDAAVPAPAGTSIYFEIDGERLAGNSGCNMFNGSISLDGNNVVMGPLVTTRKGCAEELMNFEAAILAQLEQVGSYTLEGNNLILSTADGLPLAEFASVK